MRSRLTSSEAPGLVLRSSLLAVVALFGALLTPSSAEGQRGTGRAEAVMAAVDTLAATVDGAVALSPLSLHRGADAPRSDVQRVHIDSGRDLLEDTERPTCPEGRLNPQTCRLPQNLKGMLYVSFLGADPETGLLRVKAELTRVSADHGLVISGYTVFVAIDEGGQARVVEIRTTFDT